MPSALAIWRSGAFPDRTHGAIVSALHAHGINRGRPDAPPGLRRSSTMLTVEQTRWLERRYGRGRRSEGVRDLVAAAMTAERSRASLAAGDPSGRGGGDPVPAQHRPMTDAERQRAIRERVDRLLTELRVAAESDPERLSSVDFMVLLVNSMARRMLRERAADVMLDAAQVSILVDGVVELLFMPAAGARTASPRSSAMIPGPIGRRTPHF